MKRIEFDSNTYEKLADYLKAWGPAQADAFLEGWKAGITYANEVIEQWADEAMGYSVMRDAEGYSETVSKWQPKPGDKCAFWDDGSTRVSIDTISEILNVVEVEDFIYVDEYEYRWDHCALLESLDEIGKPPEYFIERGR